MCGWEHISAGNVDAKHTTVGSRGDPDSGVTWDLENGWKFRFSQLFANLTFSNRSETIKNEPPVQFYVDISGARLKNMFFDEQSWQILKIRSQTTRFTIGITIGFGKDLVRVPKIFIVGKKSRYRKNGAKNNKSVPYVFSNLSVDTSHQIWTKTDNFVMVNNCADFFDPKISKISRKFIKCWGLHSKPLVNPWVSGKFREILKNFG